MVSRQLSVPHLDDASMQRGKVDDERTMRPGEAVFGIARAAGRALLSAWLPGGLTRAMRAAAGVGKAQDPNGPGTLALTAQRVPAMRMSDTIGVGSPAAHGECVMHVKIQRYCRIHQ